MKTRTTAALEWNIKAMKELEALNREQATILFDCLAEMKRRKGEDWTVEQIEGWGE